jgi:glutamine synthetase
MRRVHHRRRASGDIDTVLTCSTDMQGRLMGKRVDGEFFCDEVLGHGIEACDYLLALDMEMDPVAGYEMANWEEGYGDVHLLPDLQTMRRTPWLDRTALVLCDVASGDGSPVPASPRQVLQRQVDRARDLGFEPMIGSELEFYLFQDSYDGARAKPVGHRHSVGEPEVQPVLTWIGSSCHVHSSLWSPDGSHSLFPAGDGGEPSEVFGRYLGGLTAGLRDLTVFIAPNVNSYKRFASESWAPTTMAVGRDNRTCGLRLVGQGDGLRVECRIPGADANPYLAFAAIIAAGLSGIEDELVPPSVFEGNAYANQSLPRVPATLREAVDALEKSALARAAFGDEVVDHYLNYARTEQQLFDQVVTCDERERLFEQT